MIVFKIDTEQCLVRSVEGGSWPAVDAEGDTCYENTHFLREVEAWEKLENELSARLQLAQRDVVDRKALLLHAEREVAMANTALLRARLRKNNFHLWASNACP